MSFGTAGRLSNWCSTCFYRDGCVRRGDQGLQRRSGDRFDGVFDLAGNNGGELASRLGHACRQLLAGTKISVDLWCPGGCMLGLAGPGEPNSPFAAIVLARLFAVSVFWR